MTESHNWIQDQCHDVDLSSLFCAKAYKQCSSQSWALKSLVHYITTHTHHAPNESPLWGGNSQRVGGPIRTFVKTGEAATSLALVPFCFLIGIPGTISDLMPSKQIRLYRVTGTCGTWLSTPLFLSQGSTSFTIHLQWYISSDKVHIYSSKAKCLNTFK